MDIPMDESPVQKPKTAQNTIERKALKKKRTQAKMDKNKIFVDDYDILDIKIFPEVLCIAGKQMLIVKTWELIEKKKGQEIENKNHAFHIKTLRIYDNHNNEIESILTEQVDAKISSKHFYDTSIIQYENNIYYFKRIYEVLDEDDKSKSKLSAR